MTEQQSEIKIIRLNTGEDIIATCIMDDNNGSVTVGNPMRVIVRRLTDKGQSMLIMMPWLPLELVEEDLATINYNDIITVVSPKASFVEYYYDTVQQYHSLVDKKEKEGDLAFGTQDDLFEDDEDMVTEDLVQEMMDLLKDKKKQSIH